MDDMNITTINWLVLACGVLALAYGAITARIVLAAPTGNDRMREIAAAKWLPRVGSFASAV